jgi:outer membrane protein assembly factor BamA
VNFRQIVIIFIFGFPVWFNWNVYAQDTLQLKVKSIQFSGNKVTRNSIILRELEVKEGDTVQFQSLSAILTKSESNLMNTALFNFVEVQAVPIDTSGREYSKSANEISEYRIEVKVVERWYTWPFPVITLNERNFNTWWETRDFDEITYGFVLQRNNFRGRKEKLHFTLMRGYNQTVGLTYENPNINPKKTLGLSLSVFYIRNHSAGYASYNNEQLSLKIKNEYVRQNFRTQIKLTYRPQIHYYHALSLTYQRFDFMDTLITLNPNFSLNGMNQPDFFQINYRIKADFRDFQPYPLKGHYFDLEIEKTGLSLIEDHINDFVFVKSSLRKYSQIGNRYFISNGITVRQSFGKSIPYFLQKGLGFDNDFVRGYEYYVVDGQNYMLIRNNFKWTMLPRRVREIPYLKSQKFSLIHYTVYLGVHVDLAYVTDKTLTNANKLANRWLAGYGLGLDVVTYYDKVFRFEYSRNQRGENGLYVHFVAPI